MSENIICPLNNYADNRGFCFVLPAEVFDFLGTLKEMHVVQLLPDAVRGNHYHQQRKEALLVIYEDNWLFAWQPPNAQIQQQIFSGQGAVLITLEANTAHTLKNTGKHNLFAVSCANLEVMDTVRQVLIH
jgi:dTDP-4-dehydrorhamnose 3,5-epimerase-like enzyme